MSQLLNAVTVLLITLIFMPAFVYVPLPCIAAILIVAATRLIPFGVMTDLINYDLAEFLILILTCAICVLIDGAVGLMIGGVVSILRTSNKTSLSPCVETRMSDEGTVLIVSFHGQLSYVNALQAEKVA
jgi:MFS superfamily sulfate permease-like transporter